jgi:MinD superfamily P-loop ATPase
MNLPIVFITDCFQCDKPEACLWNLNRDYLMVSMYCPGCGLCKAYTTTDEESFEEVVMMLRSQNRVKQPQQQSFAA